MGMSRFFRRVQWDKERAKELEDYLAHEIDDNIARGMPPDEAKRAAQRKLGNPVRIREEIYEMNTISFLDSIWQDLRYGMRILRKNPTFSLVAILTLALGTGANAAIFQLVNALRLSSLPVEKPHELVSIGIDMHDKGRVGRGYPGRSIFTEPLWQEIRSQQQALSSLFAWGSGRWDLSTEGEAVFTQGFYVSGRFFDTLGVQAHVGRVLTEEDDQKGCGSAGAVLSHAFWQARYGGYPGVIGQTITLDQRPFEVIGIAPPGFFGVEVGRTFDVALPLCAEPLLRGQQAGTGQRAVWWLDIMGRLKPDWTVESAQAHVAAISPRVFHATVSPTYKTDWAKNYTSFTLAASPAGTGVSNLRTAYETQLWALLGATGLVLLLTCANLANLMLARSTARSREIAVRLAIGASRRRVVRQMLAESALIAGFGGLGGLLLARWISQTLVVFLNAGSTRIFVDLVPDWRVFAFIALVSVLTCVLFGLSPALQATRRDLATTMQRPIVYRWARGSRAPARTGGRTVRALNGARSGRAALRTHLDEPRLCRAWLRSGRRGGVYRLAPNRGAARDAEAEIRRHCHASQRGTRRSPGRRDIDRAAQRRGLERANRQGRGAAGRRCAFQCGRRQLLPCDEDAAPCGPDVRRSSPARRPEGGHCQRDLRTAVLP